MTESQPAEGPGAPRQARPAAGADSESSHQSSPGTAELASAEYQALRAEIVARIQKQQDIMNFAILVITALLTYAGLAKLDSSTLARTLAALGAPASLALSVFSLMTLDHEMNIAHATRYLYEFLGPNWIKVAKADEDVALQWNVARRSWQQPAWPSVLLPSTMAAAKYYAIILLNLLLALASWIAYARHAKLFTIFSLVLLIAATVLLALTFTASRYTTNLWLRMKPPSDKYTKSRNEHP